MKKILIFYAILVVVIVVFALSRGTSLLNFSFGGGNNSQSVTVGKKTYAVTVAKSDTERQNGLSKKESLKAGTGLLFVFPTKDRYGFWMNEMKFPIDIIFINDNKVVDLVENALPPATGQTAASLPVYKPSTAVNYVLEINAKEITKNKIKKGDSVVLKGIK